MKLLTVEIRTDNYPSETSWTLTNLCSGELQAKVDQGERYSEPQTLYTDDYCVPDNDYEFTIFDSFGDGICCTNGEGYYTVTFDGDEVASGGDFGVSDSATFGNPSGTCSQEVSPSVYSRVSSGMQWIERAIECRANGIPDKPEKSGKSGKSGRISISKSGKQSKK